jgi:wobble nucleotide-excising tRNase
VYNEKFIQDNFYESDDLKGIFTLSKENKVAEESVQKTRFHIKTLEDIIAKARADKEANAVSRQKIQSDTENSVWQIKTTYSGGDRVLEFCLDGLKGRKESVLSHILAIPKPTERPQATIDSLKKEVELLKSQGDVEIDEIKLVNFSGNTIEGFDVWQNILVGNESSAVAGLIEHLNNSDWVKKGLAYLEPPLNPDQETCPFCQQKSITKSFREEIKNYFDENYQKEIEVIEKLKNDYTKLAETLPGLEDFQTNVFAIEQKAKIELALSGVVRLVEKNQHLMTEKLQQPSVKVSIESTNDAINSLNTIVEEVNRRIKAQNEKVNKKAETLERCKTLFWEIMRFDYDQTISKYLSDTSGISQDDKNLDLAISNNSGEVKKKNEEIAWHQKSTINIDEAVQSINAGLIELGIDSFNIVKHQETFYRISRNGNLARTFKTLSEGEKMIISFLYFRELCRGRLDAQDTSTKRIVVIDDPISSLSHIYIFNVGRLIKTTFLKTDDYQQVFILTHSLYFFYEIVETDHDKREMSHKLFRLSKNTKGSFLAEMRYEEIQSDYQAYWYIISDIDQPPALIANSMRNILEYFFNFIEKKDLNNLFLKPELSAVRFQAFNRFINRESHSLGQNIFDYKEFNYDDFRAAFEAVFLVAGYQEHYKKMMKK